MHLGVTNPHHTPTATLASLFISVITFPEQYLFSNNLRKKNGILPYHLVCKSASNVAIYTTLANTGGQLLCSSALPSGMSAMQTHLVFAKLEKSHLMDDSEKMRGYFSNAIEPMVGGSAFTRMSLARIAIASSFVRASVPEKQCSMYSRKHGRKCWRGGGGGKKKKKNEVKDW